MGTPTYVVNDTGGAITLTLEGRGIGCSRHTVEVAPGEDHLLQDCSTAAMDEVFYDQPDGNRCAVDIEDLRRKTRPTGTVLYVGKPPERVLLAGVTCRQAAREAEPTP
jgi:hypothetical protein